MSFMFYVFSVQFKSFVIVLTSIDSCTICTCNHCIFNNLCF